MKVRVTLLSVLVYYCSIPSAEINSVCLFGLGAEMTPLPKQSL